MDKMNFKKAKEIMKQFATEYVKGKGTTADIQGLVEWMMEGDITLKQEKILYGIFNKIWNKEYKHQYKLSDSRGFMMAVSEFIFKSFNL